MIRPRPEIEALPPVSHGGFHSGEGVALDFSSNVNPFGPSPRVWEALRGVAIGEHPDPRAAPLCEFLAAHEAVSTDQILVGNGSVELIYALAIAFVRPGDAVLVVGPTFGEYAAAAHIMGARVCEFRLQPQDNFALDVNELLATIQRIKPRLLFICNPNNPTSTYVAQQDVAQILRACPDTLLVLDEAFFRFLPDAWSSNPLLRQENLLILRSLTKDYALTGLRVGYALGAPMVIGAIEKAQPPWSVNSFAQVAAVAALSDTEFFTDSMRDLFRARDDFAQRLAAVGLLPLSTRMTYFLVAVPSAKQLATRLLARHLRVRDCTSFGLPQHVRIATRRPDENAQLVNALGELLP